MNNYITLNKKSNVKKVQKTIRKLGLKKCLKNNRTTIWENDDLQISIDKSIIRILIYSKEDISYYKSIFKEEIYNEQRI